MGLCLTKDDCNNTVPTSHHTPHLTPYNTCRMLGGGAHLRDDGHLDDAVELVGEQVVGLLDIVQLHKIVIYRNGKTVEEIDERDGGKSMRAGSTSINSGTYGRRYCRYDTLNRCVIMGTKSTRFDWTTFIRRRMRSLPPGQSEQQICLSARPPPHAAASMGRQRSLGYTPRLDTTPPGLSTRKQLSKVFWQPHASVIR